MVALATVLPAQNQSRKDIVQTAVGAGQFETLVTAVHHIDRGYLRIEQKLCGLGARIRRQNPGPGV